MGYLIKIQNNKAQKLISRAFENETSLQEQVKRYPQIIPLEELDENYRPLLIIGREFTLEDSGSIDLLGIDVDGLLTLVEFKLEKNTDMRKVVAQTIEYAANLWGMSYANLDKNVRAYFNSSRCETNELKTKTLGQAVEWHHKATRSEDDEEFLLEDFIANVSGNLQKGQFRLIIFCDSADDRIKRAVEYLNELSRFDIYCATTEPYEEEGKLFFKSTFITRDRVGITGVKQYAGKITFNEFLESLPAQYSGFTEPYKTFDMKKNDVQGFYSMGTKGFAAYFSVGENKLKLFEGYPDNISLITKNRFRKKIEEVIKMPQGSIEDYEIGVSKIGPFKSSFLSKGQWASYKYAQIKPSDLTEYFDFIIAWLKRWFFSEDTKI
jgi:hypothetical protein